MRKYGKKVLSLLLCVLLVASVFIEMPTLESAAADGDVISNPEPVVDIVVNVPSDYPGTFLDFKEELTQKLVAEGMDPSTFRIVSGAIKIDTTDNSGWYVYDHYYNQTTYNSFGLNSTLQPYRAADNSNASGAANYTIAEWETSSDKTHCRYFDRHILSTVDANNKAKMVFVGYGTNALTDYMIYPAPNNSRRTFSFDIDASLIDTHTFSGAGFFINAGISGGTLQGYLIYYAVNSGVTGGTVYIRNITGAGVNDNITASTGSQIASGSFTFTSTRKARITVDLRSDSVTSQQQNYNADGTFGELITMFGGKVNLTPNGYNGFGPLVSYQGHACSSLTSFVFSDLEMTFEADAFEVLQNVQYAESAEQKYFINLTGTSGQSAIPEGDEDAYLEGIKRLTANEIFYVGTVDDGKVLSTPTATSSGVTPDNGMYATDGDFVSQIAEYINYNYEHHVHYTPVTLQQMSSIPVADFYIATKDDEGHESQVLTAHLQHFSDPSSNFKVYVKDKSYVSSSGSPITKYRLIVYDPDNLMVVNSGFVAYNSLPTYTFTRDSKQGKYIFELTVEDAAGQTSNPFQTYLTTFVDDAEGDISFTGMGKQSKATVTLTDKGFGIDDDGVTLIEGEGSGILRYQVDGGAITKLSGPMHEYDFTIPLNQAKEYTVKSWDECGNEATRSFMACRVNFDDDLSDTYYVIQGAKLGELPESPEPPEDTFFKGWSADESDTIVSSETPVTANMTLHPVFTSSVRYIKFDSNGGEFADGESEKSVKVADGSKLVEALLAGDDVPHKEGYDFAGWKLNGSDISEQTADAEDIVITAQWTVASFKLVFDPNGGSQGNLKEKSVPYGTNINSVGIKDAYGHDYTGRDLPTREGYIFKGWAVDRAGNDIPASTTMPASTYTVYAKWARDLTRYVLVYHSEGGSTINNKSRVRAEHPQYTAEDLPTSNRQGYIFDGWYYNDVKVNVGDSVPEDVDIELHAHWTPRSDTPYKIQHYFHDGNGGYVLDDSLTRALTGTTDEVCGIDPETYFNLTLDELGYSFDGVDGSTTLKDYLYSKGYWFDPDNENNILTETISGDGKKIIKIHYKRYYNVDTEAKGHGTVTKFDGGIQEGTAPIVTWIADDGYHVKRIVIDYAVRDDLLGQDHVTFNDLSLNHNVLVEFESGSAPVSKSYYNVNTVVDGINGSATITESGSVASGSNYTVNWHVNPGYYITRILVDGIDYDVDTTSLELNGIASDHNIVISTKKLPRIGGGTTTGFYTVTVNCYDTNGYFTGESETFLPGMECIVDWTELHDYFTLYALYLDGELRDLDEVVNDTYTIEQVLKNHVVDLYFVEDPAHFNSEYNRDFVTIKTRIEGGLGKVSGGSRIISGGDARVYWEAKISPADVDSDDYYAYRVAAVTVDGVEQTLVEDQNYIVLHNVTKDKEVVVYFEPDTYNINVLKYGNGTVSPAQTKYKGQSYSFTATPDEGYEIAKIVIDGEEVVLSSADKEGYTKLLSDIGSDHTIMVYFVQIGQSVDDIPENLIPVEVEFVYLTGEVISGTGLFAYGTEDSVNAQITEGLVVTKITVNDEDTGYRSSLNISPMSFVRNMAFRRLAYNVHENGNNNFTVDLGEVVQPMNVTFYGERGGIEGDGETPDEPGEPNTYTVSTGITGGPATITGAAQIEEGSSYTVNWVINDPNYEVRTVTIDGVSHPELVTSELTGSYTFSDIDKDHDVRVVIGEKPTVNVDVDGDEKPDVNIDTDGDNIPDVNVDTDGDGKPDINIDTDNTGEWKPSGEGGNTDGIWKPDTNLDTDGDGTVDVTSGHRPAYDKDGDGVDDNWTPNKDVYPNGITGAPYDTANPVLDVDSDGDGKPDYNVDTDGDGVADVNIDTDGDGKPDVNVDTDNTGTWKPSGEGGNEDGIWKPDTNLDTDGDGVVDTPNGYRPAYDNDEDGVDDSWKPDKEVKPDTANNAPYKTADPLINVDTDGDGKPDVNVDTDDDGKPDVNIDTDDDGKPDVNVDTDDDGKPDLNVDTDDDGKPDVNVDTDGDGDPDVNIDTKGDGSPNTNIDVDGDGKPDLNIDVDGDGKPDVNIDTDGDGKPDINIDTDGLGEWKPSGQGGNADGIWKPDVNIDSDGDEEPDTNLDTNGDGKPDKNIDRDGDGKADLDTPITSDEALVLVIILAFLVEISAGTIIWTSKRSGYSRLKMKK